MGTKIIYLIRHGEVKGYKGKYLGQKDPSLSSEGYQRARFWRKYFMSVKLDKIYTSDLKRTTETAHIISNRYDKIEIKYIPKIREINLGKWDGISFKYVREKYPHSFCARGKDLEHERPPDGENFSDLRNRVIIAFNEIIRETKQRSLMIAHAGVNRVLIATILKIPINDIFQIKQEYSVINKIFIKQNSNQTTIISLNSSQVTY